MLSALHRSFNLPGIRKLLAVWLVACGLGLPLAAEDEPTTDRQRLEAAYKLTQTDVTAERLQAVLTTCDSVLMGEPSDADRQYAVQLAVWALAERADQATNGEELSAAEKLAALADLDRALELDSQAWKPRLLRAWIRAAEGETEAAIADLDIALESNPKSTKGWFNRAELHYQADNLVLAIHDYTQAIILDPRDAQAYTGRGHAYFKLAKYQEALGDYQKVVLLSEGSAAALIHRADVCQAVGLWEKARDDYQLAAARDKETGTPQVRLAWLYATCPDSTICNPALAVQLAEKGVELMGDTSWAAANTLATAYASNDQADKALELLTAWEERLEGKDLELLEATRRAVAAREQDETIK